MITRKHSFLFGKGSAILALTLGLCCGWAAEKMDRGVVVLPVGKEGEGKANGDKRGKANGEERGKANGDEGGKANGDEDVPAPGEGAVANYIGWRLLASDALGAGFDVYRSGDGGAEIKLNAAPITNSCNFVDVTAKAAPYRYSVRLSGKGGPTEQQTVLSGGAKVESDGHLSYVRLPFKGDYPASKVAIADLDGDGAYDFVIKQPKQVTDPGVWNKSTDTFKVEAYKSTGELLWRKDLGWNIEQGIWYSPMVVADLDGDGKAEVALRTAPTDQDYRDEAGHVLTGPEYCTVLDGMTGRELDRIDWIPRGNIGDWGDQKGNRASRHMLGVACLDGENLSLIVHRGTYTTMIAEAYRLKKGKLNLEWRWNGDNETPKVRGQGLHGMQAADIDGDGKDEILLGSAALDHTGKFLWSTGLGHADACYVADIDPSRPGLEVMYGIEPPQKSNAICLVEARTGKLIWGCPQPTTHVHSQGLLADIDPDNPGMEFYSGEKAGPERWMYSAREGKLLSTEDLGSLAPTPVSWKDSALKSIVVRERLKMYKGVDLGKVAGQVLAVADILGDWREEIITTLPGELRIYSSTEPAASRRICLMQDRAYRTAVAMVSSGYFYPPQLPVPLQKSQRP